MRAIDSSSFPPAAALPRTRRQLRAHELPAGVSFCKIDGLQIPIVMQDREGVAAARTLRCFTAGAEGRHEAGIYSFWSVLAGPFALFILRAPQGRPIEERLREYVHKIVRRGELLREFADRVTPSSADEVELWMKAHPADAQFMVSEDLLPAERAS